MKINKVDHICIAVRDLKAARKAWEPVLGKSEPDDRYVDDREKIHVLRYQIGEVGFELMESTTADGPVAKWIEKHGEGVMVLSLNVNNTRASIKELESKDYRFIPTADGDNTRSFRNCEFAFVDPAQMNRVLLEIIDDTYGDPHEKQMSGTQHSHRFVETFDGFVGYGLDRHSNEDTVQLYLQKFSDDRLMKTILQRMSDHDLDELFNTVGKMLKKYLNEPEYHRLFLRDED
jgi:methylmalonyl-CoA/ethylmalonyl-CoA epimerase